MLRITFCVSATCAIAAAAAADADIRPKITELTAEIYKEPNKPSSYLERGDLYRALQNWDAAQADFDFAHQLDPKIEQIDFLQGRLFFEAGWPWSAKLSLDRFLRHQTNHVEALVLRARTLTKLEDRAAAAADYTRAIQLTTESRPELYLERAQCLAGAEGRLDSALKGLEEGIQRLGPLVTLELGAIEIELKQKRFDAALSRVDGMLTKSTRKESLLARKAEIFQQAGRLDDARASYRAALEAIESLPPARRNVPAMADLQKQIHDKLDQLK
jgi:tetratricopeptide (TPR) repeat protein